VPLLDALRATELASGESATRKEVRTVMTVTNAHFLGVA
jgi:hypothetical protein